MDSSRDFSGCASAPTVREACAAIVDELVVRGVELPSVYLLVGQRLRCQAARGYFQVVDGFRPDAGIIGRSVTAGEIVVVPDVQKDPAYIGAVPRIVGEISVPITSGGRAVGVVNAEATGPLPEDWSVTLEQAAACLGRRIDELGGLQRESLMQRVAMVAVDITRQTDATEIEQRALRAATELAGMKSAFIARVDGSETLRVTATHGLQADALAQFTATELSVMLGWVDSGTSSHYPGGATAPPPYDFLARAGLRSLSVYPLVSAGEPAGIFAVADPDPHPHHPEVVEALELLAALAATALGNVGTMADLKRQVAQDALTQCGNVAAFTADLDAALRGLPREHEVACLMVDVDHFKQINDTYGHPVGDLLLQDLSRTMRPVLRSTDQLYRVGGDEFAVIALVVDAAHAVQLGERLVRAARTMGTTISVGVACGSKEPPGVLRSRADDALYEAKRSGRDTVRMYGAAVEPG